MKKISGFIIKLFGWKFIGEVPKDKKYVIVSIPHTSMWDFVWGKLTFWYAGIKPVVFIKKELFFFPLGNLLRALGALPINRSRSTGMVEQIIDYYNKNEHFCICITPEGTRSLAPKLKRGFYFIAKQANVPLYLGVLDYKSKTLFIGERYEICGDMNKDMEYIKNYYTEKNPTAKHVNKFSLNSIRL